LNWARLRFRPSRLGLGLRPASSPPTPFGPWPPSHLGPARPSPSLTHGPHPFVFLLWPLGHEAAATGRPSTTGSPFGYPAELLPLPVTDVPPHLLSPLWLPTSLAPSRSKRPAIKPPPIPLRCPMHELPRALLKPPEAPPDSTAPPHSLLRLSLSLSEPLTSTPTATTFTIIAPPLRRLPSPGEPRTGTPVLPSSSSAPHPATSTAGGARGQATMSSGLRQWLPVHGGPGRRGPQSRGPSPRIFPSKINSRKSNFLIFLGKISENPLEIQTFITFQP
jgi:hypothetical protein